LKASTDYWFIPATFSAKRESEKSVAMLDNLERIGHDVSSSRNKGHWGREES
jgi:hypothetical protein